MTEATQRPVMQVEPMEIFFFRRSVELNQRCSSTFTIDHASTSREQRRINVVFPQYLENRDVKIGGSHEVESCLIHRCRKEKIRNPDGFPRTVERLQMLGERGWRFDLSSGM